MWMVIWDWMNIASGDDDQPGDHQRPRPDPVGQPTGERAHDDDHDRRRQEADAGLERRVMQDVLHVQGQEEELGQHREASR